MTAQELNFALQELLSVDPKTKILGIGPDWIRWECKDIIGHYSTATSTQALWRSTIGSGPSIRDAIRLGDPYDA